jgi:hypothetical protein
MTRLGIEDTTPEQWYKGIIISLLYTLKLESQIDFQRWWEMQAGISYVQKLHLFFEDILLPNFKSRFSSETAQLNAFLSLLMKLIAC